MQHPHPSRATRLALLIAAAFSPALYAQTYAPWLTQIGITNTVESAANWGKGQLLGVVDTGINATHPQFATGQVAQSLSSCAAVSFRCSNGFADDNGHGTAVASIAAGYRGSQFNVNYGGYLTKPGDIIGVAPSANIFAEKVLNASGSGYSTDVANGIKKAADAGATVINVSITYGNDAATIAAINYAAAKGAFIVWAGGNSAQNLLSGANSNGLSSAAVQRLIFAGSVSSSNAASSFTNKPGGGALVETSGNKTAYSLRWVMAPGENILAPMTTYGNGAYSLWSGTSMAAPIVSGALMLLQNAWPILKTNGTTANLLIATSTDLGTKGVDATYGNGLINLTRAFQPYGTLSVTKANGQSVAVTALTGSLISSGALGSLSSIQSKLANYTSFDGYARNFSVNLSGLIKTPSSRTSLNPLPTNVISAPKSMKYAGGELTFSMQGTQDATSQLGNFSYRPDLEPSTMQGFSLFTSGSGTVTGLGYGASSSYPFARALFNDDAIATAHAEFDSGSASNLAQRGYQLSYGAAITPEFRLAAGYSTTPTGTVLQPNPQQNNLVKFGAAYQITPALSAGLTLSNLAEQASLLGASYNTSGPLSFGENKSNIVGLSLAYRLSQNDTLLFNTEMAYTRAGEAGSESLLTDTTRIRSQSFAATYLQRNLWRKNDQLSMSLKQPLRVIAGQTALLTADVDADGRAIYDKTWVSLKPEAREIDFVLSYRMPAGKDATLAIQGMYQRDALNVAGNHQSTLGLLFQRPF